MSVTSAGAIASSLGNYMAGSFVTVADDHTAPRLVNQPIQKRPDGLWQPFASVFLPSSWLIQRRADYRPLARRLCRPTICASWTCGTLRTEAIPEPPDLAPRDDRQMRNVLVLGEPRLAALRTLGVTQVVTDGRLGEGLREIASIEVPKGEPVRL